MRAASKHVVALIPIRFVRLKSEPDAQNLCLGPMLPLTRLNLTWTILTHNHPHPTITSMDMISIEKGLLPNSLKWRLG